MEWGLRLEQALADAYADKTGREVEVPMPSPRRHPEHEWMLASPDILGDFHLGNLVYGFTPGDGDYFVVVDGIGEKTVIPVRSLSAAVNRIAKRRKIRRVREQIEQLTARAAR